ncbi:MAG: hypothetical protein KF884_04365 [Fimbriimonadaceae bacterium]|nr:hypothetical protein [Fimbriimonadaceae bacterium]QYK59324.1 MAG: hypothetical protein KF884_04365 [Fimbriimonadaceae bacterium]
MKFTRTRRLRNKRGAALVTTFGVMTLLALAAASYIETSTQSMREARHTLREAQVTHLCEAGLQSAQRALWRPFRQSQQFTLMTQACNGASPTSPRVVQNGTIPGVGRFTSGVINFTQVNPYLATVTIRSVGFIDLNSNGVLDATEPFKEVNSVSRFELARSQVFDYTYFINNYGWMDGFGVNDLIVNGDMRANGNFDFLNGSPTINGSVYAASNEKLSPKAPGFINTPPVKWSDNTYATNHANGATPHRLRWRQVYNSGVHGAPGTTSFEKWRDLVFKSEGQWMAGYDGSNGYVPPGTFGAVIADSRGTNSWVRTSTGSAGTKTLIDTKPTKEVVMPDLSELSRYQQLSSDFSNDPGTYQKQNFADGTANPNYGQPAYVEVWNSSTNSYQRISNNQGQVTGSAVLIGTDARPIRVYGPVTFTQDVVIKGRVTGQGTLYAGRNVHVVGSVRYSNGPDFTGNNPNQIDLINEKRDMLGLAARGSVIMGDPTKFGNPYPLYYMQPPFTKGRYDDNNNWIPPFNAMEFDSTGRRRYQSTIADATMTSIAESVNQIDAVLYTNFVGGGNVGAGGGGMTLNGTIISRDEAIVTWSLPLRLNYDNRIRERGPDQPPLIDLNLPRQPTIMRSTWQDKGFYAAGNQS